MRAHITPNRPNGFTIVELLIVIVVIGILAAITVVAFNGVQERARFAKARSDITTLNKAIQLYYAENGSYPNTTAKAGCTSNWCGWDQATGENFIPGLTPKYISVTPQMPSENSASNTYLYKSVDGTSYQLMRYSDGLPAAEQSTGLPMGNFTGVGWGYKSDNIAWG